MFFINIFILFILSKVVVMYCIWLPPYKVDLKQSEEFIIGEYTEDDFDEDEMIHKLEIENLNDDSDKFEQLHKKVKRYNDNIKHDLFYLKNNTELFQQYETDYNSEEVNSNIVEFRDKNNSVLLNQDNKNVYYLNKTTKQLMARNMDNKGNDYNYEELNKEYQVLVEKEQNSNETFNSTNVEDSETLNESLNKMVDFKDTPRNCTAEELRGIGFAAVKCVWIDVKKADTKENKLMLLARIRRIFLIWFSVYAIFAIPLWCQKGWCCCCFRCKFCKPRQEIQEATEYFMKYPPGIYMNEEEEEINYEPTAYEIDVYLKLERVLMTL